MRVQVIRQFARVGLWLALLAVSGQALAATMPAGFSVMPVSRPDGAAWNDAVGVTVSAANATYVWERAGRVWVVDAAHPHPRPLIDLSDEVGSVGELGLTGFALDPAFARTGYVYLFYSVDPGHLAHCRSPAVGAPVCSGTPPYGHLGTFAASTTRIVRYTLAKPSGSTDFRDATTVDRSSRRVLLGESVPGQATATGCVVTAAMHGAGSLAFGTDGTLLASCGDGSTDAVDDVGHSPATDAAGAVAGGLMAAADDIGAFRAQRIDSLSGKVLRLDPATGDGVASNPFFVAKAPRAARSRVWLLGLRNPERFTVRPNSGSPSPAVGLPGTLYIGDPGRDGAQALDVARTGRLNFGWPLYDGIDGNRLAGFTGSSATDSEVANPLFPATCANPTVPFSARLLDDTLHAPRWPNPCRAGTFLDATDGLFIRTRPALDWQGRSLARWSAFDAAGAPLALTLGERAVNGATVRGRLFGGSHSVGGAWTGSLGLPPALANLYVQADAGAGWIRGFRFDGNENPVEVVDFIEGLGAVRGIAAAPAGDLYVVTSGATTAVHRVRYQAPATAVPPTVAAPNALVGASPSATATPQLAASTLRPLAAAAVASPLNGGDIGAVTTAGTYAYDGTTFTLSGASADIYGGADAFQFDSTPLTGDGSITALIASDTAPNAWTKAGVMIRATLGTASSNAFMAISGANGAAFTYRNAANGTTVSVHGPAAIRAPYWVRLVRLGNAFTGSVSADGLTWSPVSQVTIGMGSSVYAGLALTSHTTLPATATFSSVSVVAAPAAPGNLTVVANGTGAQLNWTAPAAGTNGLAGYRVYRTDQAAPLATVTGGTTYLDATVVAGTPYTYYVTAFDATTPTPFASAPSASVAFSLPTQGGSAPNAPTGLQVGIVTPTTVTLNWTAATAGSNPIAGYYVFRNGATTPTATVRSPGYTDTGLQPGTTATYTVTAFDNSVPTPLQSTPAGPISATTPTTLTWTGTNVGSPGAAGSFSIAGSALTASGAGTDIYGTADSFYFVAQPFVGDGTLTARVASQSNTNGWAKAGLMIRETLAAGASHAYVAVTPSNGTLHETRIGSNAATTSIRGPLVAAPYWVRLTRAGNVFTSYISPDGNTWTALGQTTVPMATAVYAGFAVTGHAGTVLSTATFDRAALGGGGLIAPSVPGNLASTTIAPTSIGLTWSPSIPGTNPVAGYYLYRADWSAPVAVTGTSYTDSTVVAATSYTLSVAAYDSSTPSALQSAPSAPLQVTSGQGGGPIAPSAPASLSVSTIDAQSLSLSWPAATPGTNGIGGYYVYRNGATSPSATVTTGTSYLDTGLAAAASYSYQVATFDRTTPTPLVSGLSPLASGTTRPASSGGTPSAPTGLTATVTAPNTVSLAWSPSAIGNAPLAGYLIYRGGASVPIGVTAGATTYDDTTAVPGTTYTYKVVAYDTAAPALLSPPSAPASATTPGTAPIDIDIGAVGAAGSQVETGASYAVSGSGADIFGTADAFNFNYTPLIGNGSLTFRVSSQTPTNAFAKAGVMIRDSLAPGAANVFMALTPSSGPIFSYRTTAGASTVSVKSTPGIAAPYWVRLTRAGSLFTGYVSPDGITWTQFSSLSLYMAQNTYIGQAVSSHSLGVLSTAVFDSGTTATQPPVPLTVAPRNASVTLSQTQQFTATFYGQPNPSLTWAVDGIAGGNSVVGTISASGLYTPPTTPGAHTILATSTVIPSVSTTGAIGVTDIAGIYTYHSDQARTGQNIQEYALNSSTVRPATFGKAFSCVVDGDIYAQPLYVANLNIGGGVHNVIFVATMHDSVYAIDADSPSCVTYWKTAYVTGPGVTPVVTSIPATATQCTDIVNEVGILGTPIIDPTTQRIYFVARTLESGNYVQRLHALSLATGQEAIAPHVIVSGPGTSYSVEGLHALKSNQRPGLALSNGQVYVAWSSHCDNGPYHGVAIAFDAQTLAQTAYFNVTPKGNAGGIWMAGGAPAVDANGNLYLTTGNGSFDQTTSVVTPLAPGSDFGESYVRLTLSNTGGKAVLAPSDFYTPSQNVKWSNLDSDLSSSGVVVLPDGLGPTGHPNLVVGSDKQGHVWLLDRSDPQGGVTSMGGFSSTGENVVQYLSMLQAGSPVCGEECLQSTPAYWNGTIFMGVNGQIQALKVVNGASGPIANANGVTVPTALSLRQYYPGPTPVISGLENTSGVVWAIDAGGNATNGSTAAPAKLRAYDATTLIGLYDSSFSPADAAGNAVKFVPPVVANGKVYVAGSGQLTVYGLKN